VVESGTLAARLEISGASVTDDGVSCDHDGYLDPGESGTIRVTVVNAGVVAGEDVSVTATSSSSGVKLGAPIKVGFLQPFTSVDLNIPVDPARVCAAQHRHHDQPAHRRRRPVRTQWRHGRAAGADRRRRGRQQRQDRPRRDPADTLDPDRRRRRGAVEREIIDDTRNHLWLGRNAGFPSDTQLVTPSLTASGTERFVFKFLHTFALEGSPDALSTAA